GIITVELAGVKNPESVRNYLQATAKLQFWKVFKNSDPEIANALIQANDIVKNKLAGKEASPAAADTTVAATDAATIKDTAKENSLASALNADTAKSTGLNN